MNFIVNNVTVQFAHVAFLLVNMNITKKVTFGKRWKRESRLTQIFTRTGRINSIQTIASHFTDQKANLEKNSRKLKSDVDKHGDECHKAIDTVIQKYKSGIDEMNKTKEAILNKHEDEIKHTILEIKQSILDHKKRISSFDFYFVSLYKSKNSEFRSLPSQTKSSLPSFTPRQIERIYIKQQFGLLSPLPTTQLENDALIIKVECPPCLTDHLLMNHESSQISKLIFVKKID